MPEFSDNDCKAAFIKCFSNQFQIILKQRKTGKSKQRNRHKTITKWKIVIVMMIFKTLAGGFKRTEDKNQWPRGKMYKIYLIWKIEIR